MAVAWFIYINDVASGPFTTDQVNFKLTTGELPPKSFIWWKGQREWIPISTWKDQLESILATTGSKNQRPVWYIDNSGSQIGPLTQDELIDNLKSVGDFSDVRLWAVGMDKWKSLFELHDVMDLLDLSRREHERAPLMGSVAVTRSNEDPKGFVINAATISAAGMGVSGAHGLRRGDEIALFVKSPDLPSNLHLRGEVVHVTEAGYAGIRFVKVHPETASIIHDYVKRFNTESENKAA